MGITYIKMNYSLVGLLHTKPSTCNKWSWYSNKWKFHPPPPQLSHRYKTTNFMRVRVVAWAFWWHVSDQTQGGKRGGAHAEGPGGGLPALPWATAAAMGPGGEGGGIGEGTHQDSIHSPKNYTKHQQTIQRPRTHYKAPQRLYKYFEYHTKI